MPKKRQALMLVESVEPLIREIRDERVILDSDLARIYGVKTKRLNEQIRRNADRFPPDFLFQLTRDEWRDLQSQPIETGEVQGNRSQFATGSQRHRDPRLLPYAFTEHGAIMAANVLNSPQAVQMSVFVVRAFVKMRGLLTDTRALAKKLADLEAELKSRLDVHEVAIVEILQRVMAILDPPSQPEPPRKEIGFHVKETSESGTKGKTKR
jgi:ORF6N domain-containing protein